MFKNKFLKNLSWIFFGNIAHAVFQFLINVFAARILTTADFGIINYSASLIAFFTSIGTLGFTSTITKGFAEDEKNTGKYLGSTTCARLAFAVVGIVIVQVFACISEPENIQFQFITFFQSLAILFSAFNTFVYWFRYKNEANIVAIVRLISFFASMTFRLIVLYTCKSLVLYSIGCALESAVFAVFLMITYKKKRYYKLGFDKSILLSQLKTSYPIILSTLFTVTYTQIDKILLKHFFDAEYVAYYTVSLTLAVAITTITTSLVEGFQPEIMRFKVTDEDLYKKRLRQVYSLMFWVCALYAAFLCLFAKPILFLLYGEKYFASIICLQIVVWYLPFTSFYAVNNIFLICENKTVWIHVSTLLSAILSIVLNLILIPRFDIVGTAITYVFANVVAGLFSITAIPKLRFAFKLMIEGILFKDTFSVPFHKNKVRGRLEK